MAKKCRECGQVLIVAPTGRPRRFCSGACRKRAFRRRAKRPIHFRSQSDEWATPPDLFAGLDAEFAFDLDVCATPDNSKCARYFTRQNDGLAQPWTGRVWCNPPYGRAIGQWLEKAALAVETGEAELVVCLVPGNRSRVEGDNRTGERRVATILPDCFGRCDRCRLAELRYTQRCAGPTQVAQLDLRSSVDGTRACQRLAAVKRDESFPAR
jgi:phage N-6-adenine-methyltransferase